MKGLSKGQIERASEIFGNVSVAWFSAGAISPLFSDPQNLIDTLLRFMVAISFAGFFFIFSLKLAKK